MLKKKTVDESVIVVASPPSLELPDQEASVPSCYQDTKLKDSLLSSQVDNMLEFLSKKSDIRVVNQQRDDPDLTPEQQLVVLKSIFESNPFHFLNRFGKHLEYNHLECFSTLKATDGEMKLHLLALEKSMKSGSKKTQAKNRRYEALQKLVDTTDYFTEEEMQRRNPILYEQLIGRYHTKEEREAFLNLSQSSASASTATPLTDMLMAHMNRLDGNVSERRHEQQTQMELEDAAEEEYFEDDQDMDHDNDDDEEDYYKSRRLNNRSCDVEKEEESEREEIEEEEKDLFKQEFFTTMYRSFLEGKDEDFDYTTVDNNAEYDCGETLEQDEEEKYFDADEEVESESYNHLNNQSAVLCNVVSSESEIEMRASSSSPPFNPSGTHNNEESEDELDIYMKTIEKQLSK